jgi:hypothetical protein
MYVEGEREGEKTNHRDYHFNVALEGGCTSAARMAPEA